MPAIAVSNSFLLFSNARNMGGGGGGGFTVQIWNLSLSSVNWTMPQHTSEVLKCGYRRRQQEPKEMVEVNTIMHMVVSMEGRNGRCFEDRSNSIHKVKRKIV